MDEKDVQINGKGVVSIAKFGEFFTPLVNLPLLKKIEVLRGKKISLFNENKEYIGGTKLFPEEYAEAVVQDNGKVYFISRFHKETQGDYACYGYNLRNNLLSGKKIDKSLISRQEPIEIFSESTACSLGEKIFGPVFDGKINLATMVCNGPGNHFGYNNSFWNSYDLVTAIDLNSQKRTEIIKNVAEMKHLNINGKNLISVLIPTSRVPSLIKEKNSNELKNVFKEKDLDLVAQLNKAKDLDHMCFGDHSCIERSMFEMNTSSMKNYPTYRISLDLKGNIYEAERVFNQEKFSRALDNCQQKKAS